MPSGIIETGEENFLTKTRLDTHSFAMSPDGRHLADADMTGTVRIWDTRTGQELRKWQAHQRQNRSHDGP